MRKASTRRQFLQAAGAVLLGPASPPLGVLWRRGFPGHWPGLRAWAAGSPAHASKKPNLVFVFADQWRAQATGYAGNSDPRFHGGKPAPATAGVRTPNLDKLAAESISFSRAVSCCPVCSPYRASLMTGRYPLTHGVFLNDVRLSNDAVSIAQAYNQAGYETAYIGKWHLDGRDRSAFIPNERRQGFKFWRAMGCTHDYNNSFYYGDENVKLKWEGYDAIAQTRLAEQYLREDAGGKPFALFLSWGPPHDPYQTAPAKYRELFEQEKLTLRENVPPEYRDSAQKALAGYYAHIAALDGCIGSLVATLRRLNLENDTIFVFTSDHGDMLFSHGEQNKQRPWDESILVPFLLRYPAALGRHAKIIDMPINTPDIMPTLLGASGIDIPDTVEGTDFSGVLTASGKPADNAALICCPSPFGQWKRENGGREYRGIRTKRYTYVRDLKGPWLLYDNEKDPYQLNNLCDRPEHNKLQTNVDTILSEKLKQTKDEFLPGWEYIKKWGHEVDQSGTVVYTR